jgi:chemotaxis protein MotB
MAKRKKNECKNIPGWLVSFSDLMSLLLTFFILLYSMSVLDIKKLMKFLWYFQGEKAMLATKTVALLPPINLMPKDIAKVVKDRISRLLPIHAYQIAVIEDYVMIRLFNDVTFDENSLELSSEAKKSLNEIANVLKSLSAKEDMEISIEGHTSSDKIVKKIPGVKDMWDLSILRAAKVTEYLISKGVDPKKMSATGYGNTKPLYSWNNPLLKRRNNRVEIFIKVKNKRDDLLKEQAKIK